MRLQEIKTEPSIVQQDLRNVTIRNRAGMETALHKTVYIYNNLNELSKNVS